ncbi:MAG: N-acetylmuramoyl-L-alanine amidase [Candidatus Brocadiia bacterium]
MAARFCALALLLVARAGAASETARAVRPRPCPPPSSRRYVALGALATRLDVPLSTDEVGAVHRLGRGRRQVAVTAGVDAALVGSELVHLRRPVAVHYGRAYVPRALVPSIERLLGKREEEPPPPPPPPSEARYIRRVCVDPGHGGKDPGACPRGTGIQEKDLVLSASRLLASELRRRGFEVVMTRDSDVFLELEERPAVAARKRADLFVSVHMNWIAKPSIQGVELFYCTGGKYDPAARAEEAQRAGQRPPDCDVGGHADLPPHANQAVLEMLFEEYGRESRELAEELERAFGRAGIRVHSTRSAGYRVLRLSRTPAVLVELGFLSNRGERRLLQQSWYQKKLVKALADGIEAYRDRLAATGGFSH